MSYGEIRCTIAELYHISPLEVDDWTFEQIEDVLRGGKVERGIKAHSLEEALAIKADLEKNWRKYYGV